MTDRGLLEKRLTHIVDCVELLRRLARPDRIHDDPVQRGFIEHTLQTAIQSAVDAASLIVSEHRLGEPKSNSELFDLLAQASWLAKDRVDTYRRMVAFRNIVVHRYLQVDPAIVRAIVERHLDDLLDFVRTIRDAMAD